MLLGMVAWIVAGCFILTITYITTHQLRVGRRDINLTIFIFLGLFYTTLFMFLSGLAGILRPTPLLFISLAGMVLLISVQSSRNILLGLPSIARGTLRQINVWWAALPRWLKWFTAAFVLISAVRFVFLTLSLPPFVWDSLTYHLTNVAEWTQRGQISLFETSMARIYTPANYETFTLWFTVFLHHDAVIEAAGLPAYVLALASIYSIGRSLDLAPWSAWFAGLAYLSTPALVIAVTGTKNDPHMAAYFLALLSMLLYAAKAESGKERSQLMGPLLAAVLIGLLALGTKAYFMHIAPGLILIAVVGTSQGTGWKRWPDILRRSRHQWNGFSRLLQILLLALLLAGLLLGLYWNLRNWALTGNPFYPYGVRLESAQVLAGADRTAALSFSRLRENLLSLLWKFGDRQARISPDLTDTTGWGWIVYGLGIPSLVWGLLRRRELRTLFAGFAVSLVLILMSIRPSPWNMRYLLWLPAVLTIAFSSLVDAHAHHDKVPVRGLLSLAVIGAALNLLIIWNYGRISVDDFMRMMDLPLRQRGSAQLSLNMPREYANTLSLVSEEVILGYNVGENGFIYPLYRPDFSQKLTYIPIEANSSCEAIAIAMKERGTRYLFVAPVHTEDSILGIMNGCGEDGSHIQERSFNLYVLRD